MTDIVDRLKAIPAGPFIDWSICELAAAEIIRLRNQLDAARTGKALLALEAERALCDQLAEALRALYEHGDATRYTIYTDSIVRFNGAKAALAAYEAARKEGQ